MQVICTDGTTFACEGYELTEYGAMLYGQRHDPEGERYDSDPEQVGYVPHDRLWYVLPDGVTPSVRDPSVQRHPRQRRDDGPVQGVVEAGQQGGQSAGVQGPRR